MPDRKPRIGLIFTTQDRYELARMTLTSATGGIDPRQFDVTVLWLDGSITPEAVDFFQHFSTERVRLIRQSGYRGLGPPRVGQLGMNRLLELNQFDWIGMFESDCFFLNGWLDAGMRAAAAAQQDGVNVGALSVESSRTRRYHGEYVKIEVLCASNALFLPEAWHFVMPASIGHNFPKKYFADLCTIPMMNPSPELGWDWSFAMALFHAGGFETITTPRAYLLNCGTPDSHKRMFESIFAQEDFETPVIHEAEPPRQRREAQWHRAVRLCHARSDAAILQCGLNEFRYLAIEFPPSWYGKEVNEQVWWRWSSGPAETLVHNSAERPIDARLNFGSSFVDDAQVVRVNWNGEPLGEISPGACRFCRQIRIAPGTNVLRFEPSRPGTIPPADGRRLAFALVADPS